METVNRIEDQQYRGRPFEFFWCLVIQLVSTMYMCKVKVFPSSQNSFQIKVLWKAKIYFKKNIKHNFGLLTLYAKFETEVD